MILLLILSTVSIPSLKVKAGWASGTITIKADGSVKPADTDELSNDSIWNHPYEIGSGDKDPYPLVKLCSIKVESPWPMFGRDPRHTAQSPYVGAQTGKVKWSYKIASSSWGCSISCYRY